MNAVSNRWRRWAVKLVQHATCVMPGARSPWADAMRRELDYIADDAAALRWALGCVRASYRARLDQRPSFSAPAWRQLAACGALMLLIGLALQDNAGGQPAPPPPAIDATDCDLPGGSPQTGANGNVRRNDGNPDASRFRSDCAEPHPAKSTDAARGR